MLIQLILAILATPSPLSRLCAADMGFAATLGTSAQERGEAPRAVHVSTHKLLRRVREEGQSPCKRVEPELQLRERYRIASYSIFQDADVQMIEEGIRDHPMLALEHDYDKADFVLWSLRGTGAEAEGSPPRDVPPHKLVVIDWSDGPIALPYVPKSRILATFKRSFVRKKDGVFKSVAIGCHSENCFPFGYGVLNQYIDGLDASSVGDSKLRTIPLLCSLRPWMPPTPELLQRQVAIARNRVLWWLHHDADLPGDAILTGRNSSSALPVIHGLTMEGWSSVLQIAEKSVDRMAPFKIDNHLKSSADIGPKYKKMLRMALVIVTTNPAAYEGDHRLWEHFASGNAVLSDNIYTPLPYPPLPGEHFEVFDVADRPGNKNKFLDKLHKMTKGGPAVEAMACKGFQHALRHHRSVSRLDYVVRSLAEMERNATYTETGMQLRDRDPILTDADDAYEPVTNPDYLVKIS